MRLRQESNSLREKIDVVDYFESLPCGPSSLILRQLSELRSGITFHSQVPENTTYNCSVLLSIQLNVDKVENSFCIC